VNRVYLDTSALVKLYVEEPESAALAAFVVQLAPDFMPYHSLHELECAHALERRLGDGAFAARQAAEVRRWMERDLGAMILRRPLLEWSEVFAAAIRLTRRHGRKHGLRSLDSLHVAAALAIKGSSPGRIVFVTYDERQARTAKAEKFEVWP